MLALSGASGLVGRYLCYELIARQIPFKVLGRSPVSTLRDLNIPFCFFDLSLPIEESLFRSFFDGVDCFVHIAALMPHPSRRLIDYYLSNSVASKALFDLCSDSGVDHFIYLSGSNILQPIDGVVTHQSSYSSNLRHPPYLSSKMAGELLLLNSSSSRSFRFCVHLLFMVVVLGLVYSVICTIHLLAVDPSLFLVTVFGLLILSMQVMLPRQSCA